MTLIEQISLTVILVVFCKFLISHVKLLINLRTLDLVGWWLLLGIHILSKQALNYSLAPYVIIVLATLAGGVALYFCFNDPQVSWQKLIKVWWRWADVVLLVSYLAMVGWRIYLLIG